MIKYIKMKRDEIKIKSAIYGSIAGIIDSKKELAGLLVKLFNTLKDTPADEMQHELINSLAELIHGETQTDRRE